ncbi:MAG TPA: transglycosylase domain-containing protein [Rhizomicrobium sp.]|nr:transglycosylase domain-containing protein [Rhizomicrobium sp.]
MAAHILTTAFRPRQNAQKLLRLIRPSLGTMLWLSGLLLLVAVFLMVASAALQEMRTSRLQSDIFTKQARELTYTIAPGASAWLRFPNGGPYDARLGYSRLPQFIARLKAQHFAVTRQAVQSSGLRAIADSDGYAIYSEKQHAGLALKDRAGSPLYQASYPERSYDRFESVPPLVVNTLLFIEDKDLLEKDHPHYNPAVEWKRFLQASAGWMAGWLNPRLKHGGGSTLATQTEKFRHSPGGRTQGVIEKLRQMDAATLRAYLGGPDTYAARQHIVTTYVDSTPLGSRPGYGEIIGVGDGLRVWYGTDFAEANRILADPNFGDIRRKAEIYKQVLSLMLAERRPAWYLAADRSALLALTNNYLRRLAAQKVIGRTLYDAALQMPLPFRAQAPAPAPVSYVGRKGADAIRTELLRLVGANSLYDLDHVDLSATSTIDAAAQRRVTDFLAQLRDTNQVRTLGLEGKELLGGGDPALVNYSVVLYEHTAGHNLVRVHADSMDQPFDLNSGTKLQLGSTAKLRTLINYLQIVSRLHDRFAALPPRKLRALMPQARDPLSQWALGYLAGTQDRRLQPMLDAAMQRHYSAGLDGFFTGGGFHAFHNFAKWEDSGNPTVETAFANSINLAFIRILRDIERFYVAEDHLQGDALSDDPSDAARTAFLQRFADQEGRTFLDKFIREFRGLDSEQRLSLLARKTGPYVKRLTVVFRSVHPRASLAELDAFLKRETKGRLDLKEPLENLYAAYGIDRFSLADRGYLSHVHPLELWLASWLEQHPQATRHEIMEAGTPVRQEVYGWLFKTRNMHKQNWRIRVLVEQDAFKRITADWRSLGYPFGHLVPSLATAIGSSGDRPDALAELMGIILNNGVRQPTIDIRDLQFAAGTPYETDMSAGHDKPVRVLPVEVAATVRRALGDVVLEGTGKRIQSAYHAADGRPLVLGGKTGTGDNRFDSYSAGHALIESRVVDRTSTFVFYLGDRFFGTITAYVPGRKAAQFHFTSALAVQLLKTMSPQIQPLFERPTANS